VIPVTAALILVATAVDQAVLVTGVTMAALVAVSHVMASRSPAASRVPEVGTGERRGDG
jgi:hypothetical protein